MLLAKAKYPDAPLDLQIQIGWLALLLATALVIWIWTRAEPLRRALFAREDPRLFALFRIGLGLITFQNFWNLNMHWRMLWTDEGLFTQAEVRKRLGRTALTGWNEVDGFLDHWALVKFFWGKFSLLFIHSEPSFVQAYLAVMFVALVLFTVGFRTRVTAVVCTLMIASLYNRNSVFLEGHDTVFRCLWFMVLFARTDGAWSVDNWLRQRRERRHSRRLKSGAVPYDWLHFADRAGHWLWAGAWAGTFCVVVGYELRSVTVIVLLGLTIAAIVGIVEREHRRGLAARGALEPGEPARFQLIPAWPRYLFIAQLICIYSATGLYKTGSVWRNGDALYYALNMDHFYRFEGVTQWVSVYLATNVFRLMTLVTLWWEKLFVLVAIGLIFLFREQHRDEPWFQAFERVLWRKWLGRVMLLVAYVTTWSIAARAYPWCLALQKDGTPTPPEAGLQSLHILFAAVLPAFVILWFVLGRWPVPVGKLLARLPGLSPATRERLAAAKLDQSFVRKWVFGRRIWLGLGVIFHGILLTTMNIGMFPVIMMWFYPLFFRAKPFLAAFRRLAAALRKNKVTSLFAPRLLDDALSEAPELLETSEASLRRDPVGPWWLNPWTLLVGAGALLRRRERAALVDVAARGRDRGGRIPDPVVLGLAALAVTLVSLRGLEAKTEAGSEKATFVSANVSEERDARREEAEARKQRIETLGDAGHWWAYAIVAIAAASHFRRRPVEDRIPAKAGSESESSESKSETPVKLAEPQLLGGTLARTLALGFMLYHCGAIGTNFIPRYSVTKAWRGETTRAFGGYVRGINLSQSWKMFAPNPPRGNGFMRTVVIDIDGSPYQVGKDHYHDRPRVFWYNDRERKMHRRMIGKSKWYLRYWGQYHCRDWALTHDGQLPKEVRIFKLRTPIPKPDELAEAGVPSNPRERKLRTERLETHKCDADVITPQMKQRRGWELTAEDHKALEDAARQREITAEAVRKQWAARKDFGGKAGKEEEE